MDKEKLATPIKPNDNGVTKFTFVFEITEGDKPAVTQTIECEAGTINAAIEKVIGSLIEKKLKWKLIKHI